MKITGESKFFFGIIILTIIIVSTALWFFSQPSPVLSRHELIPVGVPVKGNPQARVFLVEFSDFQCPACYSAKPIVDELVNQYKDKIVFAYRHFPLDQHQYAEAAAEAAEAAGAQGKFWEMYDLLFANQDKFSNTIFGDLAKQLNLDIDAFNKAVSDKTYKDRVIKDRNYGDVIGIKATPTFFLNGKKLDLASFADLREEIKKAVE